MQAVLLNYAEFRNVFGSNYDENNLFQIVNSLSTQALGIISPNDAT
jgi:hypothetical protein